MAYINQRKPGNWQARVSWYDKTVLDKNGNPKRRTKAKQGFPSKTSAKRWANDYENKVLSGVITTSSVPTLAAYFLSWAEAYRIPKVAPKTQEFYYVVYNTLKKLFGTLKLDEITRLKYQQVIVKFGKTHSTNTVRRYFNLVRACVTSAVADGIIAKDFTQNITAVGSKDKAMKVIYPTIDQIKTLIKYTLKTRNSDVPEEYMILTAIYTGMRLSEISGLTWDRIDFKKNMLTIDRSYNYKQNKEYPSKFKPLKNEYSYRTIKINSKLISLLLELKKTNTDLIFYQTGRADKVPNTKQLNKKVKKILKATNLDLGDFHFHSLRHAHVALLHHFYKENKIPVDWYAISQRLGHSNLKTTLQVYAYLADEDKKESDRIFEKNLDRFMDLK